MRDTWLATLSFLVHKKITSAIYVRTLHHFSIIFLCARRSALFTVRYECRCYFDLVIFFSGIMNVLSIICY